MSLDYYEILGVHPSAEDFVIRAAYRALAVRYHPDKLGPNEAHLADRMTQINEAYEVLSDPLRRQEYDRSRQKESTSTRTAPHLNELFDPPPPGVSYASADWETACEYYPDLRAIDAELTRISWKLAWMFRSSLLESKTFERRWKLSQDLERRFLEVYFGSDSEIISFAKELILGGHRDAVQVLSRAVGVLGSDVPAHKLKDQVFKIVKPQQLLLERSCRTYHDGRVHHYTIQTILECLGAEKIRGHWFTGRITGFTVRDREYKFASSAKLYDWISQQIVEPILRGEDQRL